MNSIQSEMAIQGKIVESTLLHKVSIKWMDKDPNDKKRNLKCEQLITVILNKYDEQREFYDIQYEWIYDENEPEDHPFCYDEYVDLDSPGESALWRNRDSDSLVKYLVMDDIELKKYSGDFSAACFRKDIIRSIATFWEHGGKWFEYRLGEECEYPGDGTDPIGFGGEGWSMLEKRY